MNKYETIIILNPSLEEEQQKEVIKNITDLISENGKVEGVEDWGKKKLAYPIQKHQEGIYVLINFSSNPEFIDELSRHYNISEQIIKHIIVRKD